MKLPWSNYDSKGVPGVHWYMDLIRCPRKAQLSKPKSGAEQHYAKGTSIGTIGHAYAETLYTVPEFDGVIDFTDVPDGVEGEWEDIGHTVGARYARERNSAEWGEVLDVERRFFLDEADHNYLGQSVYLPFSGQADLVIDLTKDAATLLALNHGVTLDPGCYVVDHKFYSRKRATMVDEMMGSLQLELYRRMAELAYPDRAFKGAIANLTFYYTSKSNPRNEYQLIPVLPSPEMDKLVTNFWDLCARAVERASACQAMGLEWDANPAECFGTFTCGHFLGGRCSRY